MPSIKISLNTNSINAAVQRLEAYRDFVRDAGDKIAKRLAERGYNVAYGVMGGHSHSGETASSLEVVQDGPNRYLLRAGSKALLFFEFGAGARYGAGHPWDSELGYGPGTYPGNGHWDDPNGWWFPTDDPKLILRRDKNGQGWAHTYGNKPHMPFYKASKSMRDDLLSIAQEVFSEFS